MRILRRVLVTTTALLSALPGISLLRADVGIVLYESKGVDARRTDTGHVALIATNLCAESMNRLRICKDGEQPGAVITRYANLAAGYDKTVFVIPILDHFTATRDARLVPAISSGGTLEAMQMEYWRRYLKPYLPPLSQQQYEAMRDEAERFDFGRTVRQTISFEFIGAMLGAHKKHYPTEPFAIIDPLTKDLIPNGRWREAVGVSHTRNALIVTTPTRPEQEQELITYIQGPDAEPFNALSNNCSDFVKNGLAAVFSDAGPGFRTRSHQVADAWITSPLAVATDFLSYLKRTKAPINVFTVPMMAGTRRPSAPITSISRGALVPNTSQGKMAFSVKVYINTLNPLLGLTTIVVDRFSGFADLQRLVHERGGGNLSAMMNRVATEPHETVESRHALQREQVRVFGTSSCWKAKQAQFALVTSQAMELGVLTRMESAMLLKRGRPFLLPRIYEHAAALHPNGSIISGMEDCAESEGLNTVECGLNRNDPPPAAAFSGLPLGFVPGRGAIADMQESGSRLEQMVAFKLMTSIINFDLASEPSIRRGAESFDSDWNLFLQVAQRNGLHMAPEGPLRESVAACSCREFDAGTVKRDALADERVWTRQLARQGRELAFGPSR